MMMKNYPKNLFEVEIEADLGHFRTVRTVQTSGQQPVGRKSNVLLEMITIKILGVHISYD